MDKPIIVYLPIECPPAWRSLFIPIPSFVRFRDGSQ